MSIQPWRSKNRRRRTERPRQKKLDGAVDRFACDTFPWPQFDVAAGILPAVEGGILPPGPASKAKRAGNFTAHSAGLEAPALRQAGCLPPQAIAKFDAVAAAAREVRRVRAEALRHLKGGLRALYRTLEWTRSRPLVRPWRAFCFRKTPFAVSQTAQVPGANPLKDAHAALDAVRTTVSLHHFADAAVLAAYGFSAKKDLLAQLLALNQQVAASIEKGESVTPPGVPKHYPDAKKLVTEDCIRPAEGNA